MSGFPAMESYWDANQTGLPIAYLCLVILYIVLSSYFHLSARLIERKSRWTISGRRLEEHDMPRDEELERLMRTKRKGLTVRLKRLQQRISSAHIISWNPTTGKLHRIPFATLYAKAKRDLNPTFSTPLALHIGWFALLLDVSVIALMIASVIVYFSFANQTISQKSTFQSRYSVYDADASAPCRYHLIQRLRSNTTDPSQYPGQPDTWSLPPNATGLNGVTTMMSNASSLDQLWTLYGFLVSLIVTLLILNLIKLCGFQPRFSVIPASLYAMRSDFFHLVTIFVVIALPLSILVVILLGTYNQGASSFSNAFNGVMIMFFVGAGLEGPTKVIREIAKSGLRLSTVTYVVVKFSQVLTIWFMLWTLRAGMVLIIIKWPFVTFIKFGRKSKTVADDLKSLSRWMVDDLTGKSKSNVSMMALIDEALVTRRGLFAALKQVISGTLDFERSSRVHPVDMSDVEMNQRTSRVSQNHVRGSRNSPVLSRDPVLMSITANLKLRSGPLTRVSDDGALSPPGSRSGSKKHASSSTGLHKLNSPKATTPELLMTLMEMVDDGNGEKMGISHQIISEASVRGDDGEPATPVRGQSQSAGPGVSQSRFKMSVLVEQMIGEMQSQLEELKDMLASLSTWTETTGAAIDWVRERKLRKSNQAKPHPQPLVRRPLPPLRRGKRRGVPIAPLLPLPPVSLPLPSPPSQHPLPMAARATLTEEGSAQQELEAKDEGQVPR